MIDVDIEEVMNMFPIEDLQQHMIKVYWILTYRLCATFDFVMWIVPTEEIRVLALELQYILKKIIEIYYSNQFNKIFWDARHEALLCW